MQKKMWIFFIAISLIILSACGEDNLNDELPNLEVQFELPESADIGDTIELKATVIYDNEPVIDAKEVQFEYWEDDNKNNSITLDSVNHEDGTYTANIIFENEAVYSIYAHTTAEGLHTMPKRSIIVGDPEIKMSNDEDLNEHDMMTNFDMHFMEPKDTKVSEEIEFMLHLQMNENPLEKTDVHFKNFNDNNSEEYDSLKAKETAPGEYTVYYTFSEPGVYAIEIHVKDDEEIEEKII